MWASYDPVTEAPPHSRGWTWREGTMSPRRYGSPALAGMDPSERQSESSAARLPRTRGDGPLSGDVVYLGTAAPPHSRGWTFGVFGWDDF